MVLIEQYGDSQRARESQNLLSSKGIESKLAVDPLSSRAPALGDFDGLGLFVESGHADAALLLLRQLTAGHRRAG